MQRSGSGASRAFTRKIELSDAEREPLEYVCISETQLRRSKALIVFIQTHLLIQLPRDQRIAAQLLLL